MASENPSNFDELLNIQFEKPSLKREKSYGLKLAKSLFGKDGAMNSFFVERNSLWKINEDFAKGKVDHKEFLDKMGVENNKSWNNLDWNLLKVVPRYLIGTVGGFMNREEKPSVNATDILSRAEKIRQRGDAQFRMENQDRIKGMEAMIGTKLEDGFTPEDEDELDLWDKTENKLVYESLFEQTVEEVFQNSDGEDLKRQWLSDLIKFNVACSKIEKVNSKTKTLANRIRLKRCKPSRTVYNVFESPIGKDVSLIGEQYMISIADARRQYTDVTEKEWHTLAQKSTQRRNPFSNVAWQDNYETSFNRPYDDFKFAIFDFEVKVVDKDYYVKTTNQFGKDRLFKKKGRPNPQNGEAIEEVKYNMYCGTWAVDTDIMLNWELAPNQIRPYQNGIDVFSSYTIVCPDADGTLIPSLLERGVACVRQLVLCSLKIQQMMLEMRPDGVAIDIKNLQGLDIGTGGVLQPMELTKIYDTTGKAYYDSTDESGTEPDLRKAIPYTQIPNGGNAAQINTLIGLYNFWLSRLNDEWGTNPDALGQPIPARRSNKVNENLIQAANQQTEYIYDFYIHLMQMMAGKVAMMTWDTVIFEASDYQAEDMTGDLLNVQFDVNIDMIPTAENRQRLQEKINIALQQQIISLGQAIRLENMDNVKDAELYLIKLEKKQQKALAQSNQNNIEMNAKVQEQSLKMKAQADAMVKEAEGKIDALVNDARLKGESINEMQKMAFAAYIEHLKTGKDIPSNVKSAVDLMIATVVLPPQEEEVPQEMPQEEAPVEEPVM